MKVARIFGFIFLVLVVAYLLWLHSANPNWVNLPGFISLPAAVVIGVAGVIGWLSAWLPARLIVWRKNREIQKLTKRLSDLEYHVPSYDRLENVGDEPVIPDRTRNVPATDAELS